MEKLGNSTFRKVSHVIFDLDGLLLDTETLYTQIAQKILDPYNIKYSWDGKLKLMGLQHQQMCEEMIKIYSLPITWREYSTLMRKYSMEVMNTAELMPGAERLIRHFHTKNVPFCLATSSAQEMVEFKTQNYKDLFKLFNHKVCGSSDPEVKNGKPAPDIFLIAAKRFNADVNPENCLVFEDAPNGVTAARAANMQVVMVPDTNVPRDMCAHSTLILDSLENLKPEVFGLPPFDN